MRNSRLFSFALVLLTIMAGCQSKNKGITEAVPQEPDYKDTTQWYITDRGGAADIFYIISTETGDYTLADGMTYHHADTYKDSLRAPLYGEMLGVDTLVSGKLNYYSPITVSVRCSRSKIPRRSRIGWPSPCRMCVKPSVIICSIIIRIGRLSWQDSVRVPTSCWS